MKKNAGWKYSPASNSPFEKGQGGVVEFEHVAKHITLYPPSKGELTRCARGVIALVGVLLLSLFLAEKTAAQIQPQRPSYFAVDTALAIGQAPRIHPRTFMMLRAKDSTLMWTSYTGTWHEFSEGANLDSVLESGVREASRVSVLDMLAGFDVDSVSAGRVAISLDYKERPIDLSGLGGWEVMNILPARFIGIGLNNTQVDDNLSINQIECGTFDMDRENPATNEGRISWDAINNRIWVGSDEGAKVFYPGPHTEAGIDVEESDALIINQALTLDFGPGFDVTVTSGIEANLVHDYTEDPIDLSGAEATGILAAARFPALLGDVTTTAGSVTTVIGADKVLESHLKAVNTAVDEDLLTYEATTGDFEWHTLSELGIVPTTRTITVSGTTNEISVSGGTQDLSANRTWTVSLPSTLDLSSKVLQGNTLFSVEGSSNDANEAIFVVTNPSSDRTYTFPNASGTVAVSASSPVNLSSSGQISINANGIGPTQIDETANYTWTGKHDYTGAEILGASAFRFEGSSDNNIYTTFAITNPTTSTKTITFPDLSGTVSLLDQSIESSEIADGTIVNVDISASALIDIAKMATGASAQMIVLNGSGVQAYVSMSGDATIATSGAVTVASDAITYAKLQNVSATQRVLGRNSAGAGDVEEVTLTQLLDWLGSIAQGDVIYRGASNWARLPAGTNGQFLQTQGASANPQWATVSAGAATSEPFITHAATGGLSNEKVLTEGSYLDVTLGANDATVALDPTEVIGNIVWGDGTSSTWTFNSSGSMTLLFDTSAGADPSLFFSVGEIAIPRGISLYFGREVASPVFWGFVESSSDFRLTSNSSSNTTFRFLNSGTGVTNVSTDGNFEAQTLNVLSLGSNQNGVVISNSGLGALAATAAGSANQVLHVPSGGGVPVFGAIDLSSSAAVTGILIAGSFPALTGDVTTSAGSVATTIQPNAVQGTDISLASEANGSIMYHNGTDWVVLLAGTNGQVLKLASGIPSWGTDNAGGGTLVIKEGDVSVVATASSIDFGTGFDVVETPSNEGNITFDPTEIASVTWGAADGTWTFDATSGTNPTLAWSDNQLKVTALLSLDAYGASAGQGGQIRLEELAANGNNYVAWRAPDALSGDFVFRTPDGYGTNNYVLHTDGAGNTFWDTDDGAGGGAPVDAQYLMVALNGTLTNERVLVGTSNEISVNDGGANGNFTLSLPTLLTLSSKELQGSSLFRAEGGVADEFETTFTISPQTDDQSINFPNNSGTVAVAVTSPLSLSATGVISIAITDADVPNSITLDNITQITTRNHSDLQSLTLGDAGHTQFVLLAGRSGGQNVRGGTAASENLILESTSHTTKGFIQAEDKIYFPDVTTVFEFEGSSADVNETVIVVTNATADRTQTLPDASGEFSLLGQTISSFEILDGEIVNADISASAGIVLSKLVSGSSAQIIVLNGSGIPEYVSASGDVTVNTSGVFTIGDNTVDGTDLALTVQATGSVMYYDGTDWVHLGIGASGTVLKSNGTIPGWDTDLTGGGGGGSLNVEEGDAVVVSGASAIDFGSGFDVNNSPAGEANITLDLTEKQVVLTSEVTGTLPVANGGTGATTFTSNGVLLGNGTSAIQVTAAGSAAQVFGVPDGGGAPVFRSLPLHASTHQDGGTDEINVTGLSGVLAQAQNVAMRANGGTTSTRALVNFISGDGISISVDDDAVTPEIEVTISANGLAFSSESLIVASNSANLNNERALAGTANEITLTDGGANAAMTISLPTLLTLSSKELQGATLFGAEGETANAFEGTFTVADFTADRTLVFPDNSGTFVVAATAPLSISASGVVSLTTPVTVPFGGTGNTSFTMNGVVLGNGTNALTVTAAGSANQVFRVPSGGGSGAFGAIDLSTSSAVTGVLISTSFPALTGDVTTSAGSLVTSIGGDKITEAMLKAVNAAADERILTYEATGGDFEWHTPSELGVVSTSRSITINGTANEITSSAGAQDLSADRTWTLSLPTLLTLSAKELQGGTLFIAEGETANTSEGFFNVADFTGDRTFTFPDQSGTVVVAATAPLSISATGTVSLATPVTVTFGGTGNTSFTANGVVLGNGTSSLAVTSAGSANQVFVIPGGGGAPIFSAVNLSAAAAVTGNLPLANLATGTSANVIVANGSGVPAYVAISGDASIATSGALTIANDAVTFAKFQNITDNRLLGRSVGSAGDMMEISIGSGLSLNGGTLSTVGGAATIFVKEADGTPTLSANTIAVDQADGITLTDLGLGVVQIDLTDFEEETHVSEHQDGGADELSVTGLSGLLADKQKVGVRIESSGSVYTRPQLNFVSDANILVTLTDYAPDNEIVVGIAFNPVLSFADNIILGSIPFYGTSQSGSLGYLDITEPTATRNWTLPDASGEISLLGQSISLTSEISGVLPVANGGTGAGTFTSNGVLLGNGTNTLAVTSAGSPNQVLVIPDGGGAPIFGAVNLSAAAAITGSLPITNLATGGVAQILVANGSGVWGNVTMSGDVTNSITGVMTISDNAVDGTDITISGEATGGMMYYFGGNWVHLPIGAEGQVLKVVDGIPQWVTP